MSKPKRPHVWVVELREGDRWRPCSETALTRREAVRKLGWWRGERGESGRFVYRVARYERSRP